MFEFIKRLFTPSDGGLTDGSLYLENFSLTSTVRLPKKYETPGGSKVTVVTPVVDIWYEDVPLVVEMGC